jgi:hypothetical protein
LSGGATDSHVNFAPGFAESFGEKPKENCELGERLAGQFLPEGHNGGVVQPNLEEVGEIPAATAAFRVAKNELRPSKRPQKRVRVEAAVLKRSDRTAIPHSSPPDFQRRRASQ